MKAGPPAPGDPRPPPGPAVVRGTNYGRAMM